MTSIKRLPLSAVSHGILTLIEPRDSRPALAGRLDLGASARHGCAVLGAQLVRLGDRLQLIEALDDAPPATERALPPRAPERPTLAHRLHLWAFGVLVAAAERSPRSVGREFQRIDLLLSQAEGQHEDRSGGDLAR
ncbi:hypothetical protein JT358_15625 [Micrococcales bacterium 31B]|nr:hypothetical protein [Micrococcales bacterium 31B]